MPILSLFKEKKSKGKGSRKYLVGQLDAIVSRKVRDRDGNVCRKCGRIRVAHHHIFGKKAHPATRWEISNGISLCYHCHVGAHASPEDFRRWVISWMTEAAYEALYIKAQMRCSFKTVDLAWLLKSMRAAA